jgi:hypothetical protein
LLLRSRDADQVDEGKPLGGKREQCGFQKGSAVHLILPQMFRSSRIAYLLLLLCLLECDTTMQGYPATKWNFSIA